ncbi:hypothetical protein ACFTZB_30595 [Rhodococcus sp. NPDC057014]|uniref:hypothetical protein n=1 Tax=Rhodococcus sp. NPDC057014 TaxID=3346000 RepID=UPI0036404445
MWILLASFAAALGVFVASQPMFQITSCEIGVFPAQGVNTWAECEASIADQYGYLLTSGLLAIPPLLCLAPALMPRRGIAWLVAVVLLLVSVQWLLALRPTLVILGFYIPVALAALLLSAVHQWVGGRLASVRRQLEGDSNSADRTVH